MGKKSRGRPRIHYDNNFHPIIVKLYLAAGGTVEDLAVELGVSKDTLYRWRKVHKDFCDAWSRGLSDPTAKVEGAMYKRAVGFEEDAVKIFQERGKPVIVPYIKRYPPDTRAGQFLLKNWAPEKYKDKHEVHTTTDELEIGLPPKEFPDE